MQGVLEYNTARSEAEANEFQNLFTFRVTPPSPPSQGGEGGVAPFARGGRGANGKRKLTKRVLDSGVPAADNVRRARD